MLNRKTIRVVLIVFTFISLSLSFTSAGEKSGFVPAHPKLLFAALPAQVENWKLVESTGRTGLNEWLESLVTRNFIENAASEGKRPGTAVSILDTAKHPDSNLQMFKNFEEFKTEGLEYLYFKGSPMILMTGKKSSSAQVLIKGRFILTIKVKNKPPKSIGTWLKLVDMGKLNAIKEGKQRKLPRSFTSITVDELNAGNNASHLVTRGSSEFDVSGLSAEELEASTVVIEDPDPE